jgi:hypothetical protein
VLVEPLRATISARRPWRPRPYAVRKPKDCIAQAPRDLVEVDTFEVRASAAGSDLAALPFNRPRDPVHEAVVVGQGPHFIFVEQGHRAAP